MFGSKGEIWNLLQDALIALQNAEIKLKKVGGDAYALEQIEAARQRIQRVNNINCDIASLIEKEFKS